MAHGQAVGSCGGYGGAPGAASSPAPGASGARSFQIIPCISVSERYDSNVFFAPKTPGLKREDFVTNISPGLRVNHTGEYASGSLDVGGFGESYVHNPSLNYVGTADNLNLSLDNSVKRLLPNASLRITDYVRYTPTPPGFVNPAAGTSPSDPGNVSNIYAQGLLGYRTNNLINNAAAMTSYAVTPTTSLNASYSYSIIRFGSSQAASATQPLLFDTTTQAVTVGGSTKLSALDTMTVTYSHSLSEFTPHSTSAISTTSLPSASFKVDSASLGWSRILTPYLTAQVGGGGILIDPGITTYSANASLMMNVPNHLATITYARSAYPGYVGVGQALITDIVSLTARQTIDPQWQLGESANYAHSSGGGGSTASKFTTYSASVNLSYWVTRVWSTALNFSYMNFDQAYGSTKSNLDRYVVTFSVNAVWN